MKVDNSLLILHEKRLESQGLGISILTQQVKDLNKRVETQEKLLLLMDKKIKIMKGIL